jgi:hypothetical protein
MTKLADYLEKAAVRKVDCCVFMADWLVENGMTDPMSDRRGTYTPRQWDALLRSEGGILASCSKRFAAIGLRETDTPKAGDVALVLAPFAVRAGRVLSRPTGAICTSAMLRAVVARDVVLAIAALPTIRTWEVARA